MLQDAYFPRAVNFCDLLHNIFRYFLGVFRNFSMTFQTYKFCFKFKDLMGFSKMLYRIFHKNLA